MATFDPSVLSEIGPAMVPDISGSKAQAYQLKDMETKSKLNTLTLGEAEKDVASRSALDKAMSGVDINDPKQREKILSDPTIGGPDKMKFMSQVSDLDLKRKQQQETDIKIREGLIKLDESTLKTYQEKNDAFLEPMAGLLNQFDTRVAAGESPAKVKQELQPFFIQKLSEMQRSGIWSQQEIQQGMQKIGTDFDPLKIRPLVAQSQEVSKHLQEAQKAREESKFKSAETSHVNAETDFTRAKTRALGSGGDGSSNSKIQAVYGAMADAGISFPSGMRSVKAQRDTVNGLIAAHPDDSPEQIADRVRSGSLGLSGAKTALNVVERREGASAAAINALNRGGGLYDQLLETGKKVDFGSAKFGNALRLWKQGQAVADPDISEYVNALADTRAEFASVLARGGQVTDSVRIASEHAFPDKMSLSELQRNVERSRKIADAIQSGNTSVADSIIHGKPLDEALKDGKSDKAIAPFSDPGKEARYQEWKKAHPNG